MDAGRVARAALAVTLLSSCTTTGSPDGPAASTAADQRRTREFEQALARLDQSEPQSPETFNERLDFAMFLATEGRAQCGADLQRAQSQLDQAKSATAIRISLPGIPGRIADLEYRIHLGRAVCAQTPQSERSQELVLAEEAAQRASDLYQEALDYRSMVAMQFNLGIVLREMNNLSGAVAAVESAIALDREYGFEDDAKDNYATLVRWNAPSESQARAASLLQDFPKRSVTLRFAWQSADAELSIDMQHWRLHNDGIIEAREVRDLTQQTRASGHGWRVTTEEQSSSFGFGAAATDDDFSQQLMILFARSLPRSADFEVTDKGQFDRGLGVGELAAHLQTEEQALEQKRWGSIRSQHVADYALTDLTRALSPSVMEAKMAETQSLETGAWNGTTLEQGVWYDMQAPMFMPGAADNLIMNRVEFSYTRSVPCTTDAAESSCAEIVVHFTPDRSALAWSLRHVTTFADLVSGNKVDYHAATYVRMITDPLTLTPYELDERRYSYVSAVRKTTDEATELERSIVRFNYK
jgi:tetratricopeptide (TPR) repeat protein